MGKGIGGTVLITRSIVDLKVVVCEQLQPLHLSVVQDSGFQEVLQVLVIGEDVDW